MNECMVEREGGAVRGVGEAAYLFVCGLCRGHIAV